MKKRKIPANRKEQLLSMNMSKLKMKQHFAFYHQRSAHFLLGKAKESVEPETRSLVIPIISCSNAYPECFVNEILLDLSDAYQKSLDGASEAVASAHLKMMYGRDFDLKQMKAGFTAVSSDILMKSTLDKISVLNFIIRDQPLDIGLSEYGEYKVLNRFRNALIHHQPAWIELDVENEVGSSTDDNETFNFIVTLENKFSHFIPNSHLPASSVVVFLTYDIAKWAYESSINCVNRMCKDWGIKILDGLLALTWEIWPLPGSVPLRQVLVEFLFKLIWSFHSQCRVGS